MDAAKIQDKVYGGYAKAAQRVGFAFNHFRPASATNALDAGNKVGSLNAAFSPASQTNFPFNKASDYKDVSWNGLYDGRVTKVGDYLQHDTQGTFFIAAQQHLLPPLCVQCSRTYSILRERTSTQVGAVGYGGVGPGNEDTIISGFPGAMQWARQGGHPVTDFEGDLMRSGEWFFTLPIIPGAAVKERDIIADDLGRKFIAMSVYASDMGYRVLGELLEA